MLNMYLQNLNEKKKKNLDLSSERLVTAGKTNWNWNKTG